MTNDLRDKLRQLGVTKGTANIQPAPPPRRKRPIESLVDGQEIESAMGRAFFALERYAPDHRHGDLALGALVTQKTSVAAQLGREPALADVDLKRAAFLDTETTGLSGGTGTLAFLVGLGTFEADRRKSKGTAFHLRQFFLRDPDEEAAMLSALSDLMQDRQALVTFNGRGFDLPLLQTRYTLARMRPAWLSLPHLDLLAPSRRVWRDRLVSCALSSLELNVLGVRRTHEDVPSFMIPQMYLDYLRTGDAGDMARVIYHNRYDILSMVTLATLLCRLFDNPLEQATHPADLVSLGKWYDDLGLTEQAERALRAVTAPGESRSRALTHLGWLLKRQERREEVVAVWKQLAESNLLDVTAHIELAKHYEWHADDLEQALAWTQAALDLAAKWPRGIERDSARDELAHRRERLERKLKRSTTSQPDLPKEKSPTG